MADYIKTSAQTLFSSFDETQQALRVIGGGLLNGNFDYMSASYPTTTTEVYEYRVGGQAGSITSTITIVFTDATKEYLASVTRA